MNWIRSAVAIGAALVLTVAATPTATAVSSAEPDLTADPRFLLGPPQVVAVNASGDWVGHQASEARWSIDEGSDFTVFGGVGSRATGIDEARRIVGWGTYPDGMVRAYLRQPGDGQIHDLGTLGGTNSRAEHITESGLVVGSSDIAGDGAEHAFVHDLATGEMVGLGTLGGTNSRALGANEAGMVVGWSDLPGDATRHPFLYDPTSDSMSMLGDFDDDVEARAIGISTDGWIAVQAEMYDANWGAELPAGYLVDPDGSVRDVPKPPGIEWHAVAGINADGIVIANGWSMSCSHCVWPSWGYAFDPVTGSTTVQGGLPAVTYSSISPVGRVFGRSTVQSEPWGPRLTSTVTRNIIFVSRAPTAVYRNECTTVTTLHWEPPTFAGYTTITGYEVKVGDADPVPVTRTRHTSATASDAPEQMWNVSAVNAEGLSPSAEPADLIQIAFGDVDASHPFASEIDWLACNEATRGYDDGTFRPTDTVSRQALVAFLWRLAGSPAAPPDEGSEADGAAGTAPMFSDVVPEHPFHGAIAWAVSTGLTAGYDDGTFRPTAPVTRQAATEFLWRLENGPTGHGDAAGSFSDVGPDHTFAESIGWAVSTGLTAGYDDGTFRPTAPVTRQAAAAFISRQES